MYTVSIIGTGYVADFYMRSLQTFSDIKVLKAYDINPERLKVFCDYWQVTPASSLAEVLGHDTAEKPSLVLNLTNPHAHYEVSKACLEAGLHVYSEKPLSIRMDHAFELHALAKEKNLILASAPCSYLSEVAQTIWLALRNQMIGQPLLVYAELDDDYVTQAPYQKWMSESGAPWPYEDEFKVGCTLEHAGYYLSWLMMMFGSVEKVVAASAELIQNKIPGVSKTAPDYSTATLFFKSGMVARITCGIVAPHNHGLRIIGDDGVIEVNESWNNAATVKVRKRFVLRRRLVNSPFAKKVKLKGPTHPMAPRKGATAMNFALGPYEILQSIKDGRSSRSTADFSLHLNEVTLAIQNAMDNTGVQIMKTECPELLPMPWAGAIK
jgi:predicted dehydrogenase